MVLELCRRIARPRSEYLYYFSAFKSSAFAEIHSWRIVSNLRRQTASLGMPG
jgi:hypothetical protein